MKKIVLALLASLLVAALASAQDKKADPKGDKNAKNKTKADVDLLIDKVGKTPPDWWDKVTPNPPKTLDMSWPEPAPPGPWDQSKNMGQYIWSTVNENPSKWKEGVKLMSIVMSTNKDKKPVVLRAMNATGRMYHNLLEDFPRAAFWWKKADALGGTNDNELELADCYWKLGSKAAAKELLAKIGSDGTRNGNVVKLWADMGEKATALKLADEIVESGRPDVGHLVAGETHRIAGEYAEAIARFQKVLEAKDGGRDIKRNQDRAKASLEATKLFDALDLKKTANGVYTADSLGYEAPIEVQVTVAQGKIAEVKVTKHKEKQYYSSLTDTPRRIIEKQSVKGVDATTGATITSEAIINGTAKALAQGLKKK